MNDSSYEELKKLRDYKRILEDRAARHYCADLDRHREEEDLYRISVTLGSLRKAEIITEQAYQEGCSKLQERAAKKGLHIYWALSKK